MRNAGITVMRVSPFAGAALVATSNAGAHGNGKAADPGHGLFDRTGLSALLQTARDIDNGSEFLTGLTGDKPEIDRQAQTFNASRRSFLYARTAASNGCSWKDNTDMHQVATFHQPQAPGFSREASAAYRSASEYAARTAIRDNPA